MYVAAWNGRPRGFAGTSFFSTAIDRSAPNLVFRLYDGACKTSAARRFNRDDAFVDAAKEKRVCTDATGLRRRPDMHSSAVPCPTLKRCTDIAALEKASPYAS
jgi:hypothetical protein